MKLYMYTYNKGSEGAKSLSQELGIKRIKHEGSKFRGGRGKAIINWGASTVSDQALACERILNHPNAIINASNKLKTFELLKEAGVSIPPFWTNRKDMDKHMDKLIEKNKPLPAVVARTILNGHSGEGIVIADVPYVAVPAPLYVEYIPKKEEYRYHVFNGEVVDVQRKARKMDVPKEDVNWRVRNLDGGFIFAREGVVASPVASEEAIKAVAALGLDFGAVDIIWNQKEDKYYVLEVNTAPGLSGTTLEGYAKRIKEVFNV